MCERYLTWSFTAHSTAIKTISWLSLISVTFILWFQPSDHAEEPEKNGKLKACVYVSHLQVMMRERQWWQQRRKEQEWNEWKVELKVKKELSIILILISRAVTFTSLIQRDTKMNKWWLLQLHQRETTITWIQSVTILWAFNLQVVKLMVQLLFYLAIKLGLSGHLNASWKSRNMKEQGKVEEVEISNDLGYLFSCLSWCAIEQRNERANMRRVWSRWFILFFWHHLLRNAIIITRGQH